MVKFGSIKKTNIIKKQLENKRRKEIQYEFTEMGMVCNLDSDCAYYSRSFEGQYTNWF